LTAACGNSEPEHRATVFAAASLTDALTEVEKQVDFPVRYSFGGSGALVTQIEQGAPADVIATADIAPLDQLRTRNLVERPVTFALNRLQILVERGNPKSIRGLADLGRSDVTFVTQDESVPAGRYSADVLRRAEVSVSPRSRELDVKAAVAKVLAGEADATIAYVTDVRAAGNAGEGVAIPDGQNVVARYGVAVVRTSSNVGAARRFVRFLLSQAGQRVLVEHGFAEAP
jgi:molybdate transport system substrate-binding protein